MGDALDERQGKIFSYLKSKPLLFIYAVLGLIGVFGYYIRTRNLPLLIDVTTSDYIPIALDPFVFLRYVKHYVENGAMMSIDTLRYYPLGFSGLNEFKVLTVVISYWYKFLALINPDISIAYAHVIYPAVAFIIGMIMFYFLLARIFDWRVGVLGAAFLTVIPAYLYRTMAGFSDKEAFAMIFMFLTLLLFVNFILEKNNKKSYVYAALAGVTTCILWLTWGGVAFLSMSLGAFMILMILLNKINYQKLISYTIFLIAFMICAELGYPTRFTILSFIASNYYVMFFAALILGWMDYFLFKKDLLKLKSKLKTIPHTFASFGLLIIIGIITISLYYGPSYILDQASNIITLLTAPQTFDRWALTVAESHQPYFLDIVGQFTWLYLIFVFIGVVALFYETFKSFGKEAKYLTGTFAAFILIFPMTRYSANASTFNGDSAMSIYIYFGSMIIFGLYFLYTLYQKQKEEHARNILDKIKPHYLLILIFFFFTLLGARSAVRLLFTFSPGSAIVASFGIIYLGTLAYKKFEDKNMRHGAILGLALVTIFILYGFSGTVLAQAEYTGPSFNQQWQTGMEWVRENTAEDAVFAHWWDYGYWVQANGLRATLSDGGNARGAINHFIGRHLLTGYSETEALELLAANEATHVLMISDEISKYGAFSSIGSDENYDRFSYIPPFTLSTEDSYEGRNVTNLVYTGGFVLDQDLIYDGTLLPEGQAAIAGIIVPTIITDGVTPEGFQQPTAVVVYNNIRYDLPLDCIFFNGEEFNFAEENQESVKGCIMLIPYVTGGQVIPIGGSLFLSPVVYPTVFTKLYLFEEDWDYFELVYSDYESMPLMVYEGRIIGPLKIWEVSYPEDLEIPEEYYGEDIPKEVTAV